MRVVTSSTDNDYPAAVRGPDGGVGPPSSPTRRGGEVDMEAAKKGDFDSLVPKGNGDQILLISSMAPHGLFPRPLPRRCLDLWKPTVAVDGAGKVWVAWSQNVNDNWDLYRRQLRSGQRPVVGGRADDDRSRHRLQRRFHDRRQGQRLVGMAGATGQDFQIFLTNGSSPDRRDR